MTTTEVDPSQAVGRLLPEGWRVERTYAYEGGTYLLDRFEGGLAVTKRVPHGETVTVIVEPADVPLYGLTTQQPYASLIAHGIKTIETRGFQPRVVKPGGDLAIIAGAKHALPHYTLFGDYSYTHAWSASPPVDGKLWDAPGTDDKPEPIICPLSAVVAVARFVEALPMEDCPPYSTSFDDRWEPPSGGVIYLGGLDGGPWMFDSDGHGPYPLMAQLPYGDYRPGRYGWLLDNIRRLPEPIPCTGFQGLRALPADVATATRQAVQ